MIPGFVFDMPICCRYGVIRSLLRVLEQGAAAKAVLDIVVDATSAMQNLREAIAGSAQPSCSSVQVLAVARYQPSGRSMLQTSML